MGPLASSDCRVTLTWNLIHSSCFHFLHMSDRIIQHHPNGADAHAPKGQ